MVCWHGMLADAVHMHKKRSKRDNRHPNALVNRRPKQHTVSGSTQTEFAEENRRTDGRTDGQTDGRTDYQTVRQTNRRMDGRTGHLAHDIATVARLTDSRTE
jgi:hypothetical protein